MEGFSFIMNLLFLNSIGTMEMVVILLAILMLFGSKGLPGFARNIGRGMREIKDASNEIRRDIQNSALEMRKDLKPDELMEKLLEEDKEKGLTESTLPKEENEKVIPATKDENQHESKAGA